MKYDFIRCNNLNFKVKDEKGNVREGFLKVTSRGKVYVYYSNENKIFDPFLQIEINSHHEIFTDTTNFEEWAKRHELEIIPRDPETYTDWKVGDVLKDIVNPRDLFIIQARLGDMVLISDITRYYGYTYTSKCITEKCKLVLTDYEQEILKAQDEKKAKECPFKKGDRVLVRDTAEDAWIFEIFDSSEGGNEYPYDFKEDYYKQCIPYNEKTWKLLGTTDEYKEEE